MAAIDRVLDRLRAVVGDAGVLTDRNELLAYECDGLPIAKGVPTAVVFPTETSQQANRTQSIAVGPPQTGTPQPGPRTPAAHSHTRPPQPSPPAARS